MQKFVLVLFCLLILIVGCGGNEVPSLPNSGDFSDGPLVGSTNPANGASNVDLTENLVIVFDRQMSVETVNANSIILVNQTSGQVVDLGLASASTEGGYGAFSFNPSVDLSAGTTYVLTVTNQVRDVGGNALASPFQVSFTTRLSGTSAPPTGIVPPSVLYSVPANGAANVSLTGNPVIVFDREMSKLTVNSTSITLVNQTAGNVIELGTATQTLENGRSVCTFNPPVELSAGTTYVLTVTTQVRDVDGNALAAPYQVSFTTGSSAPPSAIVPPSVLYSVPTNGAANVSLAGNLVIAFDRDMSNLTVNSTSITLVNQTTGNAIELGAATKTLENGRSVFSFNPPVDLSADTTYVLTVTTQVRDVDGNALAAPYQVSFTTVSSAPPSAIVPPSVLYSVPTNSAANVSLAGNLVIVFDREMSNLSVNATSVTLINITDGYAVDLGTATRTQENGRSVFTFNPAVDLSVDTNYVLTVTTQVRDIDGNALAAPFQASFTTVSTMVTSNDTTPPTVSYVLPQNGATQLLNSVVSENPVSVVISFSEEMNILTVSNSTVTINATISGEQAIMTSWKTADKINFTSTVILPKANTRYTLKILTGVRDVYNNPLSATYSVNFTTSQ